MDTRVEFYLTLFLWLVADVFESTTAPSVKRKTHKPTISSASYDASMSSTNILLPRSTCVSICRFTYNYDRCRCEQLGTLTGADPCTAVKCPPGHLCKRFWIFPKCVVDPRKVCSLPKEVGPCNGIMPRYYFNAGSGKCEEFIYGGCGGNGNNFRFLRHCMFRCAKQTG